MKARRPARILVLDDQPKTADLLARLLPDVVLLDVDGRKNATSWREAEPFFAAKSRVPDAVVLDLRFEIPDEDLLPDRRPLGDTAEAKRERRDRRDRQGLFLLERMRRLAPDLPVLLTTAHEDIPFEDEARRLNADAFTYTADEGAATGEGLARLVRRVLREREAPLTTGRFFWGKSAAMRDLRRRVAALAPTALPLLVTGPTGTGKNFLVKEVLHPLSGRKGPFVGFDCATVPESLLQAALFGSMRGAYTGAVSDRAGVFEAAGGGTLFIDEIENLSLDAQKSLLTALNDGVVRRLGASQETPHTARVVTAANVDLREKVAQGGFRADLLMRLNPAIALRMPSLTERTEDLPELAKDIAGRFFRDAAHRTRIASHVRAAGGAELLADDEPCLVTGDDEPAIPRDARVHFVLPRKGWLAMTRHAWPGNIRQFEMVLVDLLSAAVYAGDGASLDKEGRAVFALEPRLLFDLLAGADAGKARAEERLSLPKPTASTVEDLRREIEVSLYRQAFHAAQGDFARMSEILLGTAKEERAVRLRFNKLGLSAREER